MQSNGFAALNAIDEHLCQTMIGYAWYPKVSVKHNLEGIAASSWQRLTAYDLTVSGQHNMYEGQQHSAYSVMCMGQANVNIIFSPGCSCSCKLCQQSSVKEQTFDRATTVSSFWNTGKVLSTNHSDFNKKNADRKWPSLLMGWCELRDGLADYVPTTAVELGRRFSHLEQHQDHVAVHFTTGASIDAKLVVGADGIFSKVRQQTLNDGLPDFTVSSRLRFAPAKAILHTLIRQGQHFIPKSGGDSCLTGG